MIEKDCDYWERLWWLCGDWKILLMIEKYCDDWKILWWLKKIVIIEKDCD